MSALSYGIICADCKRSSSGLCGVHSNRTILFPHAFPGLGHTESREAARVTMAMIEDVLLTIATAQGPWLRLECEDEARALAALKAVEATNA